MTDIPTPTGRPQRFPLLAVVGGLALLAFGGGLVWWLVSPRPNAAPTPAGERRGDDPDPPPPPAFPAGVTPAAPGDIPGLVLHLPFDPPGDQLTEAVGGAPLPVPRDGYWLRPGPRGLAFRAKPSATPAALPRVEGVDKVLDLREGRPFALAGWYAVTGATAAPLVVLATDQPAVELRAPAGDGRVSARLVTAQGNVVVLESPAPAGGTADRSGRWHHLALVRHSDGDLELYDDGVRVALKRDPTTSEAVAATRLVVGGNPTDRPGAANPFDGWVDEVCVYRRSLAAEEVARLAGR